MSQPKKSSLDLSRRGTRQVRPSSLRVTRRGHPERSSTLCCIKMGITIGLAVQLVQPSAPSAGRADVVGRRSYAIGPASDLSSLSFFRIFLQSKQHTQPAARWRSSGMRWPSSAAKLSSTMNESARRRIAQLGDGSDQPGGE
jgi:hypothetical protein